MLQSLSNFQFFLVISIVLIALSTWYTSLNITDQERDIKSKYLQTCISSPKQAVQYLQDQPNLLNYTDMHGWSCLINAAKSGNQQLVDYLLIQGAMVNPVSAIHTAIRGAAINGELEIVKVLLSSNKCFVDLESSGGKTALMGAAMNGHTNIVLELLNAGADPSKVNNYGETALALASRNNHTTIINILKEL